MAAPNMANVSSIIGKTAYLTPANTSENVLLANAASSGKVYKVNMVTACNTNTTTAYSASVGVNTASDGSGTTYSVVSTSAVPANAVLIVADKSTAFYLEENKSIVVKSSTASQITFIVSYEEIE